jgi:L-asparaginase / beta-aspartyl-peptidase
MSEFGRWAVIVHGGARAIPPDQNHPNRIGCLHAVFAARASLAANQSALDAVEAAVRALEDDPCFNAGFGSVLNAAGEVETDAAIMDGNSLAIGAVGAIQGVRHPISVARSLLSETPTLLVGPAAEDYAAAHGAEMAQAVRPLSAVAPTGGDTVGCIALDQHGRIAVGLSTGGLEGKAPGRVGDSPLPGCGFYADSRVGAVAFSGDGESIARTVLAARAMFALDPAGPQVALEQSLLALERVGGEAGGIALDARGRFGCAHTSANFAVALASDRMQPRAAIHLRDLQDVVFHN